MIELGLEDSEESVKRLSFEASNVFCDVKKELSRSLSFSVTHRSESLQFSQGGDNKSCIPELQAWVRECLESL